MPWLELTLAVKAEAVDWVAALLAASGHDGRVDVLTNDPLPNNPPSTTAPTSASASPPPSSASRSSPPTSATPPRSPAPGQSPLSTASSRPPPSSSAPRSPPTSDATPPTAATASSTDRVAGRAAFPFTVRLHLPADRPGGATANRIHDALDPLQRMALVGDLEIDEVDDLPPPAPLAPRRLTDRFLLLPPDATEPPLADALVPLRLPPTPAFGSGLHPATVATLRLLERHAQPDAEALDLGSGSGILSVALARLGVRVLAVDNDPLSVEATAAAARLNGVEDRIEAAHASLGEASRLGHWLGLGDLPTTPPIPPERRFDLVGANVLARLHGLLADEYRRVLRPGGLLVVGGFTRGEDEVEVARALAAAGFAPLDRTRLGDYVALALRPSAATPE